MRFSCVRRSGHLQLEFDLASLCAREYIRGFLNVFVMGSVSISTRSSASNDLNKLLHLLYPALHRSNRPRISALALFMRFSRSVFVPRTMSLYLLPRGVIRLATTRLQRRRVYPRLGGKPLREPRSIEPVRLLGEDPDLGELIRAERNLDRT